MPDDVCAPTRTASCALVADGYVRSTAADVPIDVGGAAFARLRARWETLPPDEDLRDGGAYRFRRYGRLHVRSTPDGFVTRPLPYRPFRQDTIAMWRESERHFAPLDDGTLADPCLRALVEADVALAASAGGGREWTVGLHAVRIVARAGETGLPTPEGWHRDGHAYVGMHLVGRENARGGESRIRRAGHPDAVFTLRDPLDAVLVDDRAVRHAASPITPADPAGGRTVRDMLLVDVNPA